MNEDSIAQYIMDTFPGVETSADSGYTFFFFGPGRKLPFVTIASSDNERDSASKLDRPGVFRLNVGVSKHTFQSLFGTTPIQASSYDYAELDRFMPHPDYAAWHFVCVLNPTESTMAQVKELLAEAYNLARSRAGERGSRERNT